MLALAKSKQYFRTKRDSWWSMSLLHMPTSCQGRAGMSRARGRARAGDAERVRSLARTIVNRARILRERCSRRADLLSLDLLPRKRVVFRKRRRLE